MATNGEKAILRPEVYTMNDAFDFGKYRGLLVREVIREDPEYINWCIEHVEWFKPSPNLMKQLDREFY